MLSIEGESMFAAFEQADQESPSPKKIIDAYLYTIYKSRKFGTPRDGAYGSPILCDFREARVGAVQQDTGPYVQPHDYCAHEVVFEMEWRTAVDVWNVGALVCFRLSSKFYKLARLFTQRRVE